MFSNEFDHDEIMVTVLDDYGNYEDVKLGIYDDMVIIRQWDDLTNCYSEIAMSPEMFRDLLLSMNQSEGVFYFQKYENNG